MDEERQALKLAVERELYQKQWLTRLHNQLSSNAPIDVNSVRERFNSYMSMQVHERAERRKE